MPLYSFFLKKSFICNISDCNSKFIFTDKQINSKVNGGQNQIMYVYGKISALLIIH